MDTWQLIVFGNKVLTQLFFFEKGNQVVVLDGKPPTRKLWGVNRSCWGSSNGSKKPHYRRIENLQSIRWRGTCIKHWLYWAWEIKTIITIHYNNVILFYFRHSKRKWCQLVGIVANRLHLLQMKWTECLLSLLVWPTAKEPTMQSRGSWTGQWR